jgi:hypothetical protein
VMDFRYPQQTLYYNFEDEYPAWVKVQWKIGYKEKAQSETAVLFLSKHIKFMYAFFKDKLGINPRQTSEL